MTELLNYRSLHRLSKTYSYSSSETFARHLAALTQSTGVEIKQVVIGKRRLLNIHDVARVMTAA